VSLDSRHTRALAIASGVIVVVVAVIAIELQSPGGHLERAMISPAPTGQQSPTSTPRVRLLARRDPFSPPPELSTASPSVFGPRETRTESAPPGGSTSAAPPIAPPSSTPPAPPSCGEAPILACRVIGAHIVRVARIAKRNHEPVADLVVDARPYPGLRSGERFGHGFKLIGFNEATCARIVFRDAGFTMCERP
jgi:hypothetical protein